MMLYKLIPPSVVTATIQLPASKSISNRIFILLLFKYDCNTSQI